MFLFSLQGGGQQRVIKLLMVMGAIKKTNEFVQIFYYTCLHGLVKNGFAIVLLNRGAVLLSYCLYQGC